MLYYYNIANKTGCNITPMMYYEYVAREITPVQTLVSLEDDAKLIEKYRIPESVKLELAKKKADYDKCKKELK